MDLLLINPVHPLAARYGGFAAANVAPVYPPLGLLALAAWLREKTAHRARLLDAEAEALDFAALDAAVRQAPETVIGVTLRTSAYPPLVPLLRGWRAAGKTVIAGGIHPTIDADGVLHDGAAEYVVRGEGEQTLAALLDALAAGRTVDGIDGVSWCAGGDVRHNAPRALLENLDELPLPARDLVPMERYRAGPQHYRQQPHTSMMASRGCPFACTFCSSRSLWGRRYRVRSVASVMRELDDLRDRYGIRDVCFWDDLWGLQPAWVEEFCDAMRGRGLTWSCEARVDTLTEPLLRRMAAAGCFCIFFGFESLDATRLQALGKGITPEQIAQVSRWCAACHIEVRANFMLGLPGETPAAVEREFARICAFNFDFVKFNIFTPYPGTEARAWIEQHEPERLLTDPAKFTGYFATYLPAGYASRAALEALRDRLLRRYYFRPRYIARRLRRLTSVAELRRHLAGARALLGR